MADVYDRYASPKKKSSDDRLDLEAEEIDNSSRRCLNLWGIILGLIFLLVIFHGIMVENVIKGSNNKIDLSDAIENFDNLAEIERIHLSLIEDIKKRIDERFVDEDGKESTADGGVDEIVSYLEEVRGKLDVLRSRQKTNISLSPVDQIIPPAATFKQDERIFTDKRKDKLKYEYLSEDKNWPYVGDTKYLNMMQEDSRAWLNSLAVFPYADDTHMHGIVGLNPDGSRWWNPIDKPPALTKGTTEEKEAMKRGGGFYLELSDHLPLDRDTMDGRPDVCKNEKIDIVGLPDTSIIITFFNEPLSTLLRSVHSVLNSVPPPLLREIILVDDHSTLEENQPGGPLYDAVKNLPKLKILRLPHRHGLVQARLAGIKDSLGEVSVILDSHVEANKGWMEPMLARLKESPKSLVYPQIPAIDAIDFSYQMSRGIGCKLSFKWIMQEQATACSSFPTTDPIPSASMAGGLFAVYRDFFWHMGGYDEGMTMWGAENVEMPFRYWMCGARVECMPCSRVYHIYRNGGSGYKSPSGSVSVNRLRTARLWIDDYYPLAHKVINNGDDIDIGPIDTMLAFKERMQCKSFNWFMEFMELEKAPKHLEDVDLIGQIKNHGDQNICLDSLGNKNHGDPFGVYGCHGSGGTQAWMSLGDQKLRTSGHENMCGLWENLKFQPCDMNKGNAYLWTIDYSTKTLRDHSGTKCLTYTPKGPGQKITMEPCNEVAEVNEENKFQKWEFAKFDEKSLNYEPPKHSDQWLSEHKP